MFSPNDTRRIGRSVRFTEKITKIPAREVVRRGQALSLPKAQYQGMVYQALSQNQSGFDFVMATPMTPDD